jgi:DNA-binding transcriptional ArsR family regulator
LRTPAIRPGPGSYRVLAWLARLGAAGIEPLAVAQGMSSRMVYSHVARLVEEGLVARSLAADGGGGVVALTRAGARVARETGTAWVVSGHARAQSSARHGRAVSWVAASAEVRGWRWLGPGELRGESGWRVKRDDGARHCPDLGLVIEERRTAVEVELHRKAPQRVRAILRGYRGLIDRGQLHAVSYVTDRPDVTRLIRREADAAGLNGVLRVGSLGTIVTRTRERAEANKADFAG